MISVIIPTYNESTVIGGLIRFLIANTGNQVAEIFVSDAGSSDGTVEAAAKAGAVVLHSPEKGRAAQMNYAALRSKGSVLYFVHADCFPPVGFAKDIMDAVKNGYDCGRYQTRFMSNLFLLKLNAFFTRFDFFSCYGGDQTLFIRKDLFNQLHGFDITKRIMEDYDLTVRARKNGRYKIFKKKVLISARKYELNSWLQVQRANYKAVQSYKKGMSTTEIAINYKKMLRL